MDVPKVSEVLKRVQLSSSALSTENPPQQPPELSFVGQSEVSRRPLALPCFRFYPSSVSLMPVPFRRLKVRKFKRQRSKRLVHISLSCQAGSAN